MYCTARILFLCVVNSEGMPGWRSATGKMVIGNWKLSANKGRVSQGTIHGNPVSKSFVGSAKCHFLDTCVKMC